MSSSPAVPDPQHLRASDADRERVAETLRAAAGDGRLTMDELDERLDAVYAAKTYAELVPVTQDLPDHSGAASVPAPSRPASGDVRQYGGEATSHTAVAILGGFSRKGDWVVPKTFNAFMLLGGGEIDLRDAQFAEREVSIHVVAILGGCEITVPEDATVNVNGVGILGAFEHSAQGSGGSGGPVINISGVALLGGVDVTRKPPKKSKRDKLEAKRRRELD
jgi:Domain of unknown function (DUF1707)/Cell wall-active antibiotics response 4TMS YvqF